MLMNHVHELMLRARTEKDSKLTAFWATVYSEIANVGKNNGNRDTTDKEAIAVLKKFISNAQETFDRLVERKMTDAAEEYKKQIELLSTVLPSKRPRDVIEAHVADIVNSLKGKPFGEIMKSVKEQLPDVEFDGSIAALVKILTQKS